MSMRNAMRQAYPAGAQQAKCKQSNAQGNLNLLLEFARKIGNHGTNITGFACNRALGVEYTFRRSVAQPGSAPALGAGGPRFESLYSDHFLLVLRFSVPVLTAYSSAG